MMKKKIASGLCHGLCVFVLAAGCTRADKESASQEPPKAGKAAPGAMIAAEATEPREPGAAAKEISVTSKSPEAEKLFREARDLQENFRNREADEKLTKALALDPDFAQAHALAAWSAMGDAREQHVARARQLAANLPEAEKLLVEQMALKADGQEDKARELTERLVQLAPGDWRVQMLSAYRAQSQGETDQAIAAYARAAELNPSVAQPHNNMAYLYSEQGKLDKALASIDRYAKLESGPNPYDSKGEILLQNGKFSEAEAAFKQAIERAPDFALAFEGVAVARMYAGNSKGAFEALDKARHAARDADRAKLVYSSMWAYAAAGNARQAYTAVDDMEKANRAKGEKLAPMLAALHRAEVALVLGDAKGARKGAREALDHARKHGDEKAAAKARWAHVIALKAALAEGNIEDAEKTLATIDAAAGDDDHFKSAVHFAHGSVAAAKGDIDEARAHFDKVMGKSPLRFEGRVHLANALAKAGKTDEAQKLRAELAATYRRDFYHVAIQKGLRSES